MVVAPGWDPNYADSRMHGTAAQRAMIRRAVSFCTQRRLAVDAGAHIGLTALALAECFDEVYAYEPVAENFECLIQNVRRRNVFSAYMALGQDNDTCSMVQPGENSGCWRVTEGFDVMVRALDAFDLQNVDFIKLDVEGSEGAVLKGAEKTLKRCRPVVLFESNGLGRKFYGENWVDPVDVLTELGYHSVTRIQKNEVWTC